MAAEDELLDQAINIYLTGLKGLDTFISEPASQYELSFEQFLILRTITKQPKIKLMDIAAQRQVTRSAVSRQLRILLQHDYVKQEADPADRRRMFLVATAEGQQVEAKIWQKINRRFSRWVKIYGEDRGREFLNLFDDFNKQIIQGKTSDRGEEK